MAGSYIQYISSHTRSQVGGMCVARCGGPNGRCHHAGGYEVGA